jgi:hypothetical protein
MPSHCLAKVVKNGWKALVHGTLLLFFIFTTLSCAMSGPMYGPVNKSLVEIRKSIMKAMPVEVSYASKDSREFKSVPFVRYGKKMKEATSELQRAYALIYVRGNERPYTIEVVVAVEEAETPLAIQKNFKVIGYDERIAKIILARLKADLNKRREDPNLVDDFKVF